MKNTYLQANLVGMNRINVLLFTSVILPNNPTFYLEKDNEKEIKLKQIRHISNNAVSIYELEMSEEFVFGHKYVIVLEGFGRLNVEVSDATDFPDFDNRFAYDGDDLGAIYTKEETKFNLWAPLASSVFLKIEENKEFHLYRMERTDKGVYRITMRGDYLNVRYCYVVTNSGITENSIDPWGKGASFNSEYSVVVDIEAIKKMAKYEPKTVIKENKDSIIYETSIRDFSEDKNTDILNKGKFLSLTEEGRTTSGGHPAGLDYLKFLGITHLQILPVIDFYGNDDKDISKGYNWGYNPISFFALEGSYCSKPEDGMNRLIEFKTMVETLHKNDIRLNMDVVYNHVYEFMYTCFEKVVPHYFFRRRSNGLQACASGCGNDFASEKKMARKAIIDSLKYFTEVFNIDGYRFDLMGLLDIETINLAFKECRKIKKDIIFYGEGWNMGAELPLEKKACAENADKLPGIAFFNDTYRDALKGGNFKNNITERGYVGGYLDRNDIVNYVLRGSTIDIPFKHRFLDINQSLNYVECHDNNTLFDKLSVSNADENTETLLKRVNFANELVLLSFGMPFIHMGQEIGLSKSGLDNTYNVLKVNNMNWKLVDERWWMVVSLSKFIKFRRHMFSFFNLETANEINKVFETQYWGNGMMAYFTDKEQNIKPHKKIAILINPTTSQKTYELDDYYRLFVDIAGNGEKINMKNGIIPPLSIQLLYIK